MFWKKKPPIEDNEGMSQERMTRILNLSEKMIKPELRRIQAEGNDRDGTIELTMALAAGLAILGAKLFKSDPEDFGRNVGRYVTDTMKRLKDTRSGEKEENNVRTSNSEKTESAWGFSKRDIN